MRNERRSTKRVVSGTRLACVLGLGLGSALMFGAGAIDGETTNGSNTDGTIVIRNVSLYGLAESGQRIANGMIVIREGRIVGVGENLSLPPGATVIDGAGGSVTPGLIDAAAIVEPRDRITYEQRQKRLRSPEGFGYTDRELLALTTWLDDQAAKAQSEAGPETELLSPWEAGATLDHHAGSPEEDSCPICSGTVVDESPTVTGTDVRSSQVEASSEVVPYTRVVDSINWKSPDFDRLVRGGVTTIFATSDSAAVIGPKGALIRTGGDADNRVWESESDVLASMGSDTFRVGTSNSTPSRWRGVTQRTRRPNSRMGVAKVFRKAFYDSQKGLAGAEVTGADAPPAEAYGVMDSIEKGDTPLRIRARRGHDIETALRLAGEFDLKFTLVEATEAYKCYDLIKSADLPVIFGPIYVDPMGSRAYSDETQHSRLSTVRGLFEHGIETAISAQDLREEDGLARQAMYAMRAGVDFDRALDAVTRTPARMLGIDQEVGTLESGKRGDAVLWNGTPFASTSRPVLVVMDGNIVFDDRAD